MCCLVFEFWGFLMRNVIQFLLILITIPSFSFAMDCQNYFQTQRQKYEFAEDEFLSIIEKYDGLISQLNMLRSENQEELRSIPIFLIIEKTIKSSNFLERIPDTKEDLIRDLSNSNLYAIRTVDLIVESLLVQSALDVKRGLVRNNVFEDSSGKVRMVSANIFVQNARYNDYLNTIYNFVLSYLRIKSDLIPLEARIDRISFLLEADVRFRKLDIDQRDQFMAEMQFFTSQGLSPKVVADKYFLKERSARQ